MATPYPEPGKTTISSSTCQVELGVNLNLEMVARNLKIDGVVTWKKMSGVIEQGAKKKGKKATNSSVDFANQCSVDISDVNLKIFGNGKIIKTGSHTPEYSRDAIASLIDRIRDFSDVYSLDSSVKITDICPTVSDYITTIRQNYLVLLKLFSIKACNIDLKLNLILNPKTFEEIIKNNWSLECLLSEADQVNIVQPFQIYQIIHHYYNNDDLVVELGKPDSIIYGIVQSLIKNGSVHLPVTFDTEGLKRPVNLVVVDYNANFDCHFNINLYKLVTLLNQKYVPQDKIITAQFEPSKYPGIITSCLYSQRCSEGCQWTGQKLKKKKPQNCQCKKITFLIFKSGSVMIHCDTLEQIQFGYEMMNTILSDEYTDIHLEQSTPSSDDPEIAIRNGHVTYLNRKQVIFENPRNYYILKRLGMLPTAPTV